MNKLVDLPEWKEKRASYGRRHATFIPGTDGYVEPIFVRYTQALAAVSHGETAALGTPTLLSATARCDGAAPGIALRWAAVDGASKEARLARAVGAGAGAGLVAAELRFQQVLGNGAAVDLDERTGGAARQAVDKAGHPVTI